MPHDIPRPEQSAGGEPSALARALRRLLGRQLSVSTLKTALEKEGFAAESIAAALTECRAMGYLNDERLADAWAHTARRRGKGPAWLRAKLARDGIPEALTQAAVGLRREDESEDAKALVTKRFGTLAATSTPESRKLRARAARFLASRGFGSQAIGAATLGSDSAGDSDGYDDA